MVLLLHLFSFILFGTISVAIEPKDVENYTLADYCILVKAVKQLPKTNSLWRIMNTPQRIYIGSSGIHLPGFTSYPYQELDVTKEQDFARWFCEEGIDVFHSEHTFEHISYENSLTAFKLFYKYLRPTGYVRIAVPGEHHMGKSHKPDKLDIQYGHISFWNKTIIGDYLKSAGFQRIELREYQSANSCHISLWNRCEGMVRRSFMHDARNEKAFRKAVCEDELRLIDGYPSNFTAHGTPKCSLIVDAYKL